MNKYETWKNSRQKLFDSLPVKFAFSEEQFKKGMAELGVENENELFSFGYGGFMRKADKHLLDDFLNSDDFEKQKQDREFLVDMFYYELGNHEYGYTYDLQETLDACEVTRKDLQNELIADCLEIARQKYLKDYEQYN